MNSRSDLQAADASPKSTDSAPSRNHFRGIWYATAAIFVLSWLVAPGTLNSRSILSMLPFAAVLAVASGGQTLVLQQRGIDLTVAGQISLAAVIVTRMTTRDGSALLPAIGAALVACMLFGALTGVVIAKLRVTPLVATLAMNAVIVGAVRSYTQGSPSGAAPSHSDFALGKTAGVPNTVLVAIAITAVLASFLRYTAAGRRFVAIGANENAARAAGIEVDRYRVATYIAAAACYAVAGILLAGYVNTPGLDAGDPYLFSSITAVIIGGTALTGGRGSVVASAIAALFLSQLVQMVLSVGAPTSIQLVVQAAVIAGATVLRDFNNSRVGSGRRSSSGDTLTEIENKSQYVEET